MYDYIIKNLNIAPDRIKNLSVTSDKDSTKISIELVPIFPDCPYCGGPAILHGHNRPKNINHPRFTDQKCSIIFISSRYLCKDCGKTFSEDNPFTFTNFKNSYFSLNQIMKDLSNLHLSYKDIAIKNNVSPTTVQRYQDSFIHFPRQTLPESIGIDEIYSKMANRTQSKYLCVMVDNINRSPFEILPSRSKNFLSRYFSDIPREERLKVKYVTIDMWIPYKDIATIYFPNCQIAVDPFHVIQHLELAMAQVRINIQNKIEYGSDAYYLLKTWKGLLEHNVFLDNEPKFNSRFNKKVNKRELLNMILDINDNLSLAYRLKEMYLDFNEKATPENCEEQFDYLFKIFSECEIPEYREFTNLISNWKQEILNSFQRPYNDRKQSNALAENINGKIRTYLSVIRGAVNFTRFRKRILYALNPKIMYSVTKFLNSDKYQGKNRGSYNK